MTTTTELRARLSDLQTQHDAIYRELLPFAQTGIDGRVRWSDIALSTWFRFQSVDPVRAGIVAYLSGFLVTDDCRIALLGVPEIVALTVAEGFDPPRKFALDYLEAR
jgi:hypothetical protein